MAGLKYKIKQICFDETCGTPSYLSASQKNAVLASMKRRERKEARGRVEGRKAGVDKNSEPAPAPAPAPLPEEEEETKAEAEAEAEAKAACSPARNCLSATATRSAPTLSVAVKVAPSRPSM